jgi:signal transduction histidine kinase
MRARLTSSSGYEIPSPQLKEPEGEGVELVLAIAGTGWWRWRETGNELAGGGAIGELRGGAPTSLPQLFAQVHRDDRARVQEVVMGVGGELSRLEYRLVRSDGSVRWVQGSIRRIDDEDGGAVLGVEVDIDAQKRDQAELRARAEASAKANQDKEKFVYICSHDLREPLRMVTGFLGLLERRATGLDQRARDYLALASDGALRLNGMLEDLLGYSRCGRSLQLTMVPLGEAVAAARIELEEEIRTSGAELAGDIALPAVNADQQQLVKLLRELIDNAVKFRSGPEPRIAIGAERIDHAWVVTVIDDGIGIPPADRERVFEVFHRLHLRETYPGNGVGLALCAKIAEQHGGRIWIEARPDGASGTVVKVSFPDA